MLMAELTPVMLGIQGMGDPLENGCLISDYILYRNIFVFAGT